MKQNITKIITIENTHLVLAIQLKYNRTKIV
jgi:hypothetical protein